VVGSVSDIVLCIVRHRFCLSMQRSVFVRQKGVAWVSHLLAIDILVCIANVRVGAENRWATVKTGCSSHLQAYISYVCICEMCDIMGIVGIVT